MSDNTDAPAKRKSFLRKIFSQAEPAPSKKPVDDETWRSQAAATEDAASSSEQQSGDVPDTVLAIEDSAHARELVAPPVAVDAFGGQPDQAEPEPGFEPTLADDMRPLAHSAEFGVPVDTTDSDDRLLCGEEESASMVAGAQSPETKRTWWSRLRQGLSRSSNSIGAGIGDIFTKRKLDASTLDDLEDVLIRADLGVATATRICEAVGKGRYDRGVTPDEVKTILANEVERVLTPHAQPFAFGAAKPFVVLVVGVNGSGKTTTIAKLAAKLTSEGKRVTLAAGDTFRAAAIAQLRIWGERLGCPVIAREQGSDAAGLAYAAIEEARAGGADVLLMDTAGRLQNRTELMAELEKIIRVMRKLDASAPHAVLLVLDATVGQNAMSQVEIFGKVAGVTGLVMTKLDGTARGGILVAIADKFALPIHFIGVGETADDLEPFAARDFAMAIAGLDLPEAA